MHFAAQYRYARAWGLALVFLLGIGSAAAAPYADIVMDMRDGRVLHATDPDRKLHPASLTKMMTLYLTFEAVRSGQLGLDSTVRVSRNAAAEPASKLYLKAGERVTIRSLIRAAAIKSANDAATALAEAVAGSEAAFARLMTQRARELGMTNTTFRNAHGLTVAGHLSTARDMATLGRRLFFDFPEFYGVFSRKTEIAAGRRIASTNRLLSNYDGADGIKTGYTAASGYSLVASARRGDRQIVATILGARSSGARNARMAELLDLGFSKARPGVRSVAPAAPRDLMAGGVGADAPVPSARPATTAVGLAALGELLYDEAEAAVAPATGLLRQTPEAPRQLEGTRRAPQIAALPRKKPGSARVAAAPTASPDIAPVATPGGMPLPPRRPAWAVQLGAYGDRDQAVASVTQVTLGGLDLLAAAQPRIDEVAGRSGKLWRVRFTGLGGAGEARRACDALKAHGQDCITVAPGH